MRTTPEAQIQEHLIKFLQSRGWFVIHLHASMFMAGLPDLLAYHRNFGHRLIEVKRPHPWPPSFTPAQRQTFPRMIKAGAPIFVLTGVTDYPKLFTQSPTDTLLLL